MKRVLAITTVLVATGVLAVFATGASDNSSNYVVRAIFDNASFVIAGEDVKIAGVKVGKVKTVDVTTVNGKKAAISLSIEEKGFQDFRTDAHCTIRPQSLIGERFVECTPTAPRKPGDPEQPKLSEIKSGPGKGELNLPVANTSTPVDIDLINNILRRPYAERLSLILNELGTGLAGNGKELNAAIKRANPAIGQVDEVLAILAKQNRQLVQLAVDGDTVLAPLARERARVADFIRKANTTAEATAEERGALEENLRLLPPFLRQLQPTMERVGGLADEMTPVLTDLNAQAPNINKFIEELGPFSKSARPAVRSLGEATEVGGPALEDALPIVKQVDEFSTQATPLADNLEKTLTSLKDTGGVERIMDYAFFQVAAINGFDSIGRYLRAGLIVNLCSSYAVAPVVGCSANFAGAGTSASAAGASGNQDPILARTRAALRGAKPENILAAAREDRLQAKAAAQAAEDKKARKKAAAAAKKDKKQGNAAKKGKKGKKTAKGSQGPIALPPVTLPGGIGQIEPAAPHVNTGSGAPVASSSSQTSSSAGGRQAPANSSNGLLDYLLGSG